MCVCVCGGGGGGGGGLNSWSNTSVEDTGGLICGTAYTRGS